MTKMFTVVGIATLNGQVKFRVANGTAKARTAVMARAGATNINLIDLETPMNKEAAIEFFQNNTPAVNRNDKLENLTKRAKLRRLRRLRRMLPLRSRRSTRLMLRHSLLSVAP
jgi:hypothetical protein